MIAVVKYVSSLDSALLEIGKTSDLFILCWYLVTIPISFVLYKKFMDKRDESKKNIISKKTTMLGHSSDKGCFVRTLRITLPTLIPIPIAI